MTTNPFADAVDAAQKTPSSADPASDLFAATKARLTGVAPGTAPSPFAGVAKMDAVYHCKRFIIGNEMSYDGEGKKRLDPTSDDEELEELMQSRCDGTAIIVHRNETFLQDGTVVVWVEWLTPKVPSGKEKPAERPPHARTVGELLDPRVPPASEGAIPSEAKGPIAQTAQGTDVFDVPTDSRFDGELGESHEDEEDY